MVVVVSFTKENVDQIIAEAILFKLENYGMDDYSRQLNFCCEKGIYCFEYHRRHPGEIREKMRRKKLGLNAIKA